MDIEEQYVVLDVETNGLKSKEHDLLSISIYKPDEQLMYNRFLPLELQSTLEKQNINGITMEDIKDAQPLTQEEVDELIIKFELDKRVILTYSDLDKRFIRDYFKRKHLVGYENMHFYNFKREIISSCFATGNVTKDNLCRAFNVSNIKKVHSSTNDCLLEWELFKIIDEKTLFITDDNVFELNEDYIIPAGYLSTHKKLKNYIGNVPDIEVEQKHIKHFLIYSDKIKKFPTNFNGITIEHLINSMLEVNDVNSKEFLLNNKKKLTYVGRLPNYVKIVPLVLEKNGMVTAINNDDKALELELNIFLDAIKKEMGEMIRYIKEDIFKSKRINSQELVVNHQDNILALCDLSTDDVVMEIKTSMVDTEKIKYQLYYESKGRKCYLMQTNWLENTLEFLISEISFVIYETLSNGESCRNDLNKRWNKFQNRIQNKNIIVTNYINLNSSIKLKCKICENEWETSCNKILKKPVCPFCDSLGVK